MKIFILILALIYGVCGRPADTPPAAPAPAAPAPAAPAPAAPAPAAPVAPAPAAPVAPAPPAAPAPAPAVPGMFGNLGPSSANGAAQFGSIFADAVGNIGTGVGKTFGAVAGTGVGAASSVLGGFFRPMF